ncbi:MAG: Coagulation factor 5/8 type domain-containing protein, partial [Trebonia sp.]
GVHFVRERTGQKTFDFNRDGVAHYGLMADLIGEMQHVRGGGAALPLLFRSAEAYLEAWQRAWRN